MKCAPSIWTALDIYVLDMINKQLTNNHQKIFAVVVMEQGKPFCKFWFYIRFVTVDIRAGGEVSMQIWRFR